MEAASALHPLGDFHWKRGLAQTPHRILRWVRADREYLEAIFGKPCYDPDIRLAIP